MIEYLPLVLTGIGIIVSILYYTNVLRNQNTQRNTNLYLEYFNRIFSDPLKSQFYKIMTWSFEDYDDFEKKYGKLPDGEDWFHIVTKEPMKDFVDVLFHNEVLGVLWSTNTIDIEMVARMSEPITAFWSKYEELIYEWRRRTNLPLAWVEFEDLYLRLLEYSEKHNPVSDMVVTFKSRRKALGLPTYTNR